MPALAFGSGPLERCLENDGFFAVEGFALQYLLQRVHVDLAEAFRVQGQLGLDRAPMLDAKRKCNDYARVAINCK